MRRMLDTVGDALFVAWMLPWALYSAWCASREEARDERRLAADGGCTVEERRRIVAAIEGRE